MEKIRSEKMEAFVPNVNTFKGIVIFILGDKEFCINLANVAAIIKPGELESYYELFAQRISLLKKYNGTFPFVDVKSSFGFEPRELTSESRIILIDCDFIIIGLYVEKVKEIIKLDINKGTNELKYVPLEGNIYIEGMVTYENRGLLFLSLEKICAKTGVG